MIKNGTADENKLLKFGFEKASGGYVYKKALSEGFYAVFKLYSGFTVNVYDGDFDEEYALFNVVDAEGATVGRLRAEVLETANRIAVECFTFDDVRGEITDYILKTYGAEQRFPWGDLPDASPFYNDEGKWFALIMEVPYKKLGIDSDGNAVVINLKNSPERVAEEIDGEFVFPAYHMNKKYWLTALLDKRVTERVKRLIAESYAAVKGFKK